jgi:hypothetical protein
MFMLWERVFGRYYPDQLSFEESPGTTDGLKKPNGIQQRVKQKAKNP